MTARKRAKRKLKTYWDSCVFISWMKNEKRAGKDMHGVAEAVHKVEAGQMSVITSRITPEEEIDAAKHTTEAMDKLRGLLSRSNVEEKDVTPWIRKTAEELVEHYAQQHAIDGAGILTWNDAIHLATALSFGVDALYTFDNGKKPAKVSGNSVKSRSLLSLDGDLAGRPLKVCKPPVHQLSYLVEDDEQE